VSEEEKEKPKMPEFIVLEDKYWKEERRFQGQPEFEPEREEKGDLASTLKLKAICLLLGSLAVLWTAGTLVLTLFAGMLSLLFFRQILLLNNLVTMYWSWCRGGAAVTLGFYVALFSLFLGVVIIISYFSKISSEWQKMLLAKLLHPHFKKYM